MAHETIEQLRETQRAVKAHANMRVLQVNSMLGRAKAEGRPLTTTEQSKVDALQDDADNDLNQAVMMEGEIEQSEAFEQRFNPANSRGRVVPAQRLGGGGASASQAIQMTGAPTFAAMFPGAPRQAVAAPFRNLGEFARAVQQGDPRLHDVRNAASGASEGVAGDGGFFVPLPFFADLMDASLQGETIRPGAMIVPMTASTLSIPAFDLSNRSTGIAGLEGKATPEGVTGTTQKPKVREVLLAAAGPRLCSR